MGRKTRRRIKRRSRNKYTQRKKGFVGNLIHFFIKGKVTDRYTKVTTLMILVLEFIWVALEMVWFSIEMFGVE